MSITKQMHGAFTEFFEAPSSETLRPLLKLSVGETNNIDYKEQWPEKDKLAKHVLALANSQGGILIVGVAEADVLQSTGLEKLKDKTDISKQLSTYIPKELTYEVLDFNYKSSENSELKGKMFQVLLVECNPAHLPYIATKSGSELKNNTIYVRRGCSSVEAEHADVRVLFDLRIGTQEAAKRLLNLDEHLEQLKLLYGQREQQRYTGSIWENFFLKSSKTSRLSGMGNASLLGSLSSSAELQKILENANKPETYNDFITECIRKKKRRIRHELDIIDDE